MVNFLFQMSVSSSLALGKVLEEELYQDSSVSYTLKCIEIIWGVIKIQSLIQ